MGGCWELAGARRAPPWPYASQEGEGPGPRKLGLGQSRPPVPSVHRHGSSALWALSFQTKRPRRSLEGVGHGWVCLLVGALGHVQKALITAGVLLGTG